MISSASTQHRQTFPASCSCGTSLQHSFPQRRASFCTWKSAYPSVETRHDISFRKHLFMWILDGLQSKVPSYSNRAAIWLYMMAMYIVQQSSWNKTFWRICHPASRHIDSKEFYLRMLMFDIVSMVLIGSCILPGVRNWQRQPRPKYFRLNSPRSSHLLWTNGGSDRVERLIQNMCAQYTWQTPQSLAQRTKMKQRHE